jgi:hypothetical protein
VFVGAQHGLLVAAVAHGAGVEILPSARSLVLPPPALLPPLPGGAGAGTRLLAFRPRPRPRPRPRLLCQATSFARKGLWSAAQLTGGRFLHNRLWPVHVTPPAPVLLLSHLFCGLVMRLVRCGATPPPPDTRHAHTYIIYVSAVCESVCVCVRLCIVPVLSRLCVSPPRRPTCDTHTPSSPGSGPRRGGTPYLTPLPRAIVSCPVLS